MGTYKQFEPSDILQSTITAKPRILLASGTTGWHGNTGVSGTIGLFGDSRARTDVRDQDLSTSGLSIYPLATHDTRTIDGVVYISGSYPVTASIKYSKVRNTESSAGDNQNRYDSYFDSLSLLYEYHKRYNLGYFTGSHDFYSLCFKQNSANTAAVVSYSGSNLSTVTSSYTIEAWIKPLHVTSSNSNFTIASQRTRWKFSITGSSGALLFTDYATFITSSVTLTPAIWSHVGFSGDSVSGTFYVNRVPVTSVLFTGTILPYTQHVSSSHLAIGAEYTVDGGVSYANNGFDGFIYETKIWNKIRSTSQISGSWNRTLSSSETPTTYLSHYSRFNDGPLSTNHGFSMGSGVLDYSTGSNHGQFINFRSVSPLNPIWQPNDNQNFFTFKTNVTSSLDFIRILDIPSLYYGRQIATGSVILECHAYENQGIVRTLRDDGKGNLYLSGSLSKPISGEDYAGVTWRKVGNVFYGEGIIAITDPSLWDFGDNFDATDTTNTLRVTFEGIQKIPTKTFMCRIGAGDFNASNNTTFSAIDAGDPTDLTDDKYIVKTDTTYITAIGFYDEMRRLIAVAKIAQPIRNKPKEKLTLRPAIDF